MKNNQIGSRLNSKGEEYTTEAVIKNVTVLLRNDTPLISFLIHNVDSTTAVYQIHPLKSTFREIMKAFNVKDISHIVGRKITAYWDAPCGSPAIIGFKPND